ALLKDVVARLSQNADDSVQLLAYAQGENRSKSRRLSLSRALAVRSYLLSQDIRNTRIEVRALGDQIPDGKPDRVDVILQRP
ncbi:MAG: OmpA family protein, partial [Rhodospirillaceae bacterium]|nr:OmpA family protein [Rhodospirillaceae bacterium]